MKKFDFSEAVFYNLSDAIIIADLEGNIQLFNSEAEKILGVSAKDLNPLAWAATIGCYLPDKVALYPPEELPLFKVLQGERVNDELIYIKNTQWPSGLWISVSGQPINDNKGNHCGNMAILRDITEYLNLKESIKYYKRLSAAVEQTADSVIITNSHGIIEYVNRAFEVTTGYSFLEALGKTPRILKSGKQNNEFYQNLWKEIMAGRQFRCTIVNKKKNGDLYWAEESITPIKGDNGVITYFVSVVKDITDLIENKDREAKLNVARAVQQRFYEKAPAVSGYDIAASTYPVDETGGDYYDFINSPDGSIYIAVGDVCGHGIGAALLMAETRGYLHAMVKLGSDVSEILTWFNRLIKRDLEAGYFITLFLCKLDTDKRIITYSSAGHVPGLLFNKNGVVDLTLDATGVPLGLFSDVIYSSKPIPFSDPGQIILLLTDGITESLSFAEAPFGDERIFSCIASNRNETASEIRYALLNAVRGYAGNEPQSDDMTIIVIKAI
jgi:sigma-B regulation protein RsbU (phosphoserine phosphatase)